MMSIKMSISGIIQTYLQKRSMNTSPTSDRNTSPISSSSTKNQLYWKWKMILFRLNHSFSPVEINSKISIQIIKIQLTKASHLIKMKTNKRKGSIVTKMSANSHSRLIRRRTILLIMMMQDQRTLIRRK